MDRHLHEYVWMVPPGGGDAEKVSTKGDEISTKMFQGWRQCDPPAAMEEK
jgi:hypothetical protein